MKIAKLDVQKNREIVIFTKKLKNQKKIMKYLLDFTEFFQYNFPSINGRFFGVKIIDF